MNIVLYNKDKVYSINNYYIRLLSPMALKFPKMKLMTQSQIKKERGESLPKKHLHRILMKCVSHKTATELKRTTALLPFADKTKYFSSYQRVATLYLAHYIYQTMSKEYTSNQRDEIQLLFNQLLNIKDISSLNTRLYANESIHLSVVHDPLLEIKQS